MIKVDKQIEITVNGDDVKKLSAILDYANFLLQDKNGEVYSYPCNQVTRQTHRQWISEFQEACK